MPDLMKYCAVLIATMFLCAACSNHDDNSETKKGDGSNTFAFKPEHIPHAGMPPKHVPAKPTVEPQKDDQR